MANVTRLNEVDVTLKSSFRTLAIFEYFADVREPASLGEISKALNIPQSSTSALVKSLVDSGYLHINTVTRKYFPTRYLSFITGWMREEPKLDIDIQEAVRGMSLELGQTVVIAMRNGIYSQYILANHVPRDQRLHVETGSIRPLTCAASGWAMLMKDSDFEIGKLIRRTHADTHNEHWRRVSLNSMKHVQQAWENRYAFSKSPMVKATAGIAMPLPTSHLTFRAAVTVAGSEAELTNKHSQIIDIMTSFVSRLPKDITEHILCETLTPRRII